MTEVPAWVKAIRDPDERLALEAVYTIQPLIASMSDESVKESLSQRGEQIVMTGKAQLAVSVGLGSPEDAALRLLLAEEPELLDSDDFALAIGKEYLQYYKEMLNGDAS